MNAVLTLVAPETGEIDADTLAAASDVAETVAGPTWLKPRIAADLPIDGDNLGPVRSRLAAALAGRAIDFAVQPTALRRKRLLLADMDSTLIGQECIDELGHALGIGEHIAAITEQAMRGELDFETALAERVALLKGLEEDRLAEVYETRIRFNAGGRTLVRTMGAQGALTRLVSGGFTYFADKVAAALGFEMATANRLELADGRLTGKVTPPIFGRQSKFEALKTSVASLGITDADAVAVGDGANDLAMIGAAGLGVAYRAKPIVAIEADARVDHADLTAILYFQGYRAEEFVID